MDHKPILRNNRYTTRWKEAKSIHNFLLHHSQRPGATIEKALDWVETSSFYISKDMFIVSVVGEFLLEQRHHVERNLILFYNSFDGSKYGKVDSREIIITYISFDWKRINNPENVFFRYYNIFSDSSGRITVKELLSILTVASVTKNDFWQFLSKFQGFNNISLSKKIIIDLFDTHPSILIHFREQIMQRIVDKILLCYESEVRKL